MKRKIASLSSSFDKCRLKLKSALQKARRLKSKVKTLTDITNKLKSKGLVSEDCAHLLEQTFSGVPLQVMKRLLKGKGDNGAIYHPAIKAFALTLQFYSSKAYEYVRETFGLSLPHLNTIRRWYSSVDGRAGFSREVFFSLEQKVEQARREGKKILCALMLDEMAIKKQIDWDGHQVVGFVDIGAGTSPNESNPPATDALVLMAVCVNGSWKVPLGYFLIGGMTGVERANLVREALLKLSIIGICVVSVTCDGPSTHFTMLRELGASLDPNNLDPSFPDPANADHRIQVMLDVCHMLKLLRTALASCGLLKDGEGSIIRWQYLVELHDLQQQQGLHLANKLRAAHINFHQQKMKVKLAAQALSASVAQALLFCRDDLKLAGFQNCAGTVKFLQIVNDVFDILNSRNKFAKQRKAALQPANAKEIMACLDHAFNYFASLTDVAGNKMTSTPKKTAFIGFMAAIKSVKALFEMYVGDGKPLEYLLTYKLSQDHLELFFGAVRAYGGSSNNPTAKQFIAIYKRMMMRHQIKTTTGNVEAQDVTSVLTCADMTNTRRHHIAEESQDVMLARRFDLLPRSPMQEDHDYADVPCCIGQLSEFQEAAVGYIAGYAVKMVCRSLHCDDCLQALRTKMLDGSQRSHGFILHRDFGGLVKPSESVLEICLQSERCLQRFRKEGGCQIPRGPRLTSAVCLSVLRKVGSSVFADLQSHMLDTEAENNHVFALVKSVCHAYCTIRLHHMMKELTTELTGKHVRKHLNKMILFKHQ